MDFVGLNMKKILSNIYYWFKVPGIMLSPYSEDHDAALLHLLNYNRVEIVDRFTVIIGGTEVWVANMPYRVGIKEIMDISRPSRKTIYLLNKQYNIALRQYKKRLELKVIDSIKF